MANRTRLIIAALCLLYIAARLWRLGDSCLWFDEIFSVHAAEHDWGSLFSFVAKDLIHPPLFYVVLKGWVAVGGESVFWLRLLPVVFSAAALFPLVRLCKELKLKSSVIFLSLFLLAVNGALIKYTQTLRMYSMLMFLALLSMWLFARYFNRGKSWVPLVIANVLLVYTHYFGWLVIGAEVVAILWMQRIKWRRALVMLGVVGAAFLPWAITVWQAARNGSSLAQNIAWQARPRLRELITFATDLIEPFYFQASSAEPSSIYAISTPMLLVCTTAVALFVMEWKREEGKHAIYLLVLFVALPFVVAFAASWILPHSVWGTRHLIIVLPPALILIAHSMMNTAVRGLRYVLAASVVVIAVTAFLIDARREMPVHVWCAWNGVAADIQNREAGSEQASIYAFENLVAYHLWFALRDTDKFRVGVIKGVDAQTDDETYFLPRGFDGVASGSLAEIRDNRFWLAFRATPREDGTKILEAFRAAGYTHCGPQLTTQYGSTTVVWLPVVREPRSCAP
jgi:4-amino-4-deoxy-L-arabinose transferase-like glycosyltransferase